MKNPWVAIMVHAAKGKGLRLSPDEVYVLSRDSAIEACASDDVEQGGGDPMDDWSKVNPKKYKSKLS